MMWRARAVQITITVVLLSLTCLGSVDREDGNLAANPGFEEPTGGEGVMPEGWMFFSSDGQAVELTDEACRSGAQSLKVKPQNVAGAHMGLATQLEVLPKERYVFSVHVRNCKEHRIDGSFHGVLSIEWLDENGEEIKRVQGKTWGKEMSRMRWTREALTAKAPYRAAQARFVINVYDGDRENDGYCFIDDVEITAK